VVTRWSGPLAWTIQDGRPVALQAVVALRYHG
jgi:hypothetical protein